MRTQARVNWARSGWGRAEARPTAHPEPVRGRSPTASLF